MALRGEYVPSSVALVRDQVAKFEASNGAEANTVGDSGLLTIDHARVLGSDNPIVVMTSVGRTSGKLRKTPLMRVEKGGKYVAIASRGGAPDHPEWFHNLVAHPEVELQDGVDKHTYLARQLEGEECVHWWQHAVRVWPPYGEYQQKTDREIPVFLLEPTD